MPESSLNADAVTFIPKISSNAQDIQNIRVKKNKRNLKLTKFKGVKTDKDDVLKNNDSQQSNIELVSCAEKNTRQQKSKRRHRRRKKKSNNCTQEHTNSYNSDGLKSSQHLSGDKTDSKSQHQKQKINKSKRKKKLNRKQKLQVQNKGNVDLVDNERDFPILLSSIDNDQSNYQTKKLAESTTLAPTLDWSEISSQTYKENEEKRKCHRTTSLDLKERISESQSMNDFFELTTLSLKRDKIKSELKTSNQIHKIKNDSKNLNNTLEPNLSDVSASDANNISQLAHKNESKLNMTKLRDRWWNLLRQRDLQHVKKSSSPTSTSTSQSNDTYHSSSSSLSDSSGEINIASEELEYTPHNKNLSAYQESINCKSELFSNVHEESNMRTYPMHIAICEKNASLLQYMMSNPNKYECHYGQLAPKNSLPLSNAHIDAIPDTALTPIQLSVYLDQPNILKVLLDAQTYTANTKFTSNVNFDYFNDEDNVLPISLLILAIKSSFDGCVKVLLSHGTKLASKTKVGSNSVFHVCCSAAKPTTFHLLLNAIGKGSIRTRMLSSRNKRGQTPLHVACCHSRIDMVRELLSYCAIPCTKAYTMEDADGFTPLMAAVNVDALEVVTLLLMWEGNHGRKREMHWKKMHSQHIYQDAPTNEYLESQYNSLHSYKSKIFKSGSNNTRLTNGNTPLQIAISRQSVDMVRLLIELSNPISSVASHPLQLNKALSDSMKCTDESIRIELLQVIVEAGANPYVVLDQDLDSINMDSRLSPIQLAVQEGDISALRVMIDSFERLLHEKQQMRRNDQHLKRQPETFFAGKDSKENESVHSAINEALLSSLYQAWISSKNKVEQHNSHLNFLRSSYFLYKRGAHLGDPSFSRLIKSMSRYSVGKEAYYPLGKAIFRAKYMHFSPILTDTNSNAYSQQHTLSYWSSILSNLDWFWRGIKSIEQVQCAWIREESSGRGKEISLRARVDMCYLVVENQRLLAHREILSMKSQKLDAAMRFALLQQNNILDEEIPPIDIHLDVSLKMAYFLVQHCYHGSIIFGLSIDKNECCRELLELAVIAEEYICPTLFQEVEMRLISSKPRDCFSWCCCDRIEQVSHHATNESPEASSFFCHYSVESPSNLINAQNAIDTLSLSKEDFIVTDNYTIKVHQGLSFAEDASLKHLQKLNHFDEYVYHTPLASVKAVSLKTILQDFSNIIKSDTYFDWFHEVLKSLQGNSDSDNHKQLEEEFALKILQNALDELLGCSFRKQSLHAKKFLKG